MPNSFFVDDWGSVVRSFSQKSLVFARFTIFEIVHLLKMTSCYLKSHLLTNSVLEELLVL